MHAPARLGLLVLACTLPLAAQSSTAAAGLPSCPAQGLNSAAAPAVAVHAQLRRAAVPAGDSAVPASIATLLAQFKSDLADTAAAVFRCAPVTASTDQIQTTLADLLHANRASATETVLATRDHKDIGSFGSDLAVQVFQLFGQPKIFEVDFRFGVECGDDNLLLVFQAPSEGPDSVWHEQLRWGASHYATVGDALGDFILLTPLTGNYQHPTWRYLVAHGKPSCGELPRPSRFALDLLTPAADPASPTISWHFEDAYSQGNTVPRLATTEDTIDFRILPAPPADAKDTDSAESHPPAGAKPSPAAPAPQIYRFHLNSTGDIVAVPASATPADAPKP